ncbi:hypothetical protein CHS0354_038838 [Potamilus streckersoni]|uniref:Uncharacterized protein n=1 Tax=Potamilus streckersoni TaxID=2493646 RepID=A0AAE0WDH3_9BIVA|nr:hypothetical protein CHS0354_038838 [Potamilus streckersoni]
MSQKLHIINNDTMQYIIFREAITMSIAFDMKATMSVSRKHVNLFTSLDRINVWSILVVLQNDISHCVRRCRIGPIRPCSMLLEVIEWR